MAKANKQSHKEYLTPAEIVRPQPGQHVSVGEQIERARARLTRKGFDPREIRDRAHDAVKEVTRPRGGGWNRPHRDGAPVGGFGPGKKLGDGRWLYSAGQWKRVG